MVNIFNDILARPLGGLTSDEYDIIRRSAVHFPDGVSGSLWGKVIMRAVEEVATKEGKGKAITLIEEAHAELNRIYPHLFDEKSALLKRACMLSLEEGEQETAHKEMEEFLYNALAQVHNGADNGNMPYYSFRGFSPYSIDDIAKETISLSHPREFNDPLDTILVYWLNDEIKRNTSDELQLKYRLLMKKVAEHIKIRCLISGLKDDGSELPVEDLNVLMWSHYANSHKGFCVKYEFDKSLFDLSMNPKKDKVLFVDKVSYKESIEIDKEPSIRMALLEKSDFWKYEREMRMVSYDCSGKDKEHPIVICKGAAKAIYLGVKCSDSDRRNMEKAIGDKNIPLYQMSVDENKLTRFKKTLIG